MVRASCARAWICALVCLSFLPATRAAAPAARKIAVFVKPATRVHAARAAALQRELRAALEEAPDVTSLPGAHSAAKDIAASVEAGYRALNDGDGERATAVFKQALAELLARGADSELRLLARVTKGLGVAHALSDRFGAAKKMIRASLNLWPAQREEEYAWTTLTLATFREVDVRRQEEAPGAIDVFSEPADVSLQVGGAFVGLAPMTIRELPAGLHWVVVRRDGFAPSASFVEVKPGEEEPWAIALTRLDHADNLDAALERARRAGTSQKRASVAVNQLRTLTEADETVFLTLDGSDSKPRLSGWYARPGTVQGVRMAGADASGDGLRASLGKLLGLRLTARVSQPPLDGPPAGTVIKQPKKTDIGFKKPPVEPTEELVEQWWFWTTIVVVSAGLAAMIAVSATSGSGSNASPSGSVTMGLRSL